MTLSFAPDPDEGRAASPEYAATWGSFQLWVNGLNLCKHQEQGISVDSVNWYMFPLLRWMIDNWDFLFHEERLPNQNRRRDAWRNQHELSIAPSAYSDDAADAWEEAANKWWQRHALLASRDGGLFPDVIIRRFRNSIEFSWGPTRIAGMPGHCSFHESHGYARVDPTDAADTIYDVLDSATKHLVSECPEDDAFIRLRNDFQSLSAASRLAERLGLIAGFTANGATVGEHYEAVTKSLRDRLQHLKAPPFIDAKHRPAFVDEAPQACLMFGSLSPTISSTDVRAVAALIEQCLTPEGEGPLLKRMTRDVPIASALELPWEQGYELAESLHEATDYRYTVDDFVDIDLLINDFGIFVTDIGLADTQVRAIAIAGEHVRPTIAINSQYRYPQLYPRRFTLAHELCHLLHDRMHGIELAIASGPWAPVDIEKRANAFAAMFLMPRHLLRSLLARQDMLLTEVASVWRLCDALQVSFTALVEHICNLGFIDEDVRDAMKSEVIDDASPDRHARNPKPRQS